MRPGPDGVSRHASLVEVATALRRTQFGVLPVVVDTGDYLGVVTARGVSDALADGHHDAAAAALATELPVTVGVGEELQTARETLSRTGMNAMPVLSPTGAVVGWLTYRDLLATRRKP
jgi:CIC family chloride channel protein